MLSGYTYAFPDSNGRYGVERASLVIMHRCLYSCWIIVVLFLGCGRNNFADTSTGSIVGRLGNIPSDTTVDYVANGDEMSLVVWSDFAGSSSTNSSSSSNEFTLTGEIKSGEGEVLPWDFEVDANGKKTVTISAKPYDLANGNVFLVSHQNASFEVSQLKRGTMRLRDIEGTIRQLAQDQEVVKFFSSASIDREN